MDLESFLEDVPTLSDLELAVLLSLVAQQHCLLKTEDGLQDDLATELGLIASKVFGLSHAVTTAEDHQSVEKFGEAILNQEVLCDAEYDERSRQGVIPAVATAAASQSRLASVNIRAGSTHRGRANSELDRRMVANIIIAKNFNHAHRDVQIAALELIERRRIYSRTTVHPVPKVFLFIPLVVVPRNNSSKAINLNHHLNDRLFISHHHGAEDGFFNKEEEEFESQIGSDVDIQVHDNDEHQIDNMFILPTTSTSTTSSSSQQNPTTSRAAAAAATVASHNQQRKTEKDFKSNPRIPYSIIESLQAKSALVQMTPEIRRYLQDVVVFLRMAKGVDGGISAFATTMLVALTKHLAPLHGIDYVTPSLVGLAARKVYPHRIVVSSPEQERSMQWGSQLDAVKEELQGLTPEIIIENCLSIVKCPV